MFEFDAGKLIIIGIVALIVIGPKDFPRVMIQLGQAVAKMRRMAGEFRSQFMDAMRESEMESIKSDVTRLAESAKTEVGADPLAEIKAELASAMHAADKVAAPSAGANPALAAPSEANSPVSSAAQPGVPGGADGEAKIATSVAAQASSPARATGAEMQALAEAMAAELGEAASRPLNADGAAAQGKV
jgi:sec-independent protein translocase protein TatB